MQLKLLMLMVRLKINSSDLEVQEGLTILDVARNAGFFNPHTLP